MNAAAPLQAAYVIHHRPYRNTSLLLELFTRESGRAPAVARGVRAGPRGRAGLLQPFVPLLVGWAGRGEVRTLTSFDAGGAPPALRGRGLYCGFYLNELLMRLLGRCDAHPGVFDCYRATLAGIADGETEQALRRFELRLLQELGYGLQLQLEAGAGTPVEPDKRYRYEVERGAIEQPGGGYSGRTLLALAGSLPAGEAELRESRTLMRSVLSHYLGERPLKSRELFGPHRPEQTQADNATEIHG